MPLGIGRRVLVTGMAGSGKSTLSRSLAARPACRSFISTSISGSSAGLRRRSRVAREKQSGLLAGDAWIADGNYHETLDLRLERGHRRVSRHALVGVRETRVPAGPAEAGWEMPEGCDDPSWRRLRDEWRLAIVIWRNCRSEPEREQGDHLAVRAARGPSRARVQTGSEEFLDGLNVEYTEADDG